MTEHLACAWLLLVAAALVLFTLAALAKRIGRARPAPVIVTDADPSPKTNRTAVSGRGNQRHPAA